MPNLPTPFQNIPMSDVAPAMIRESAKAFYLTGLTKFIFSVAIRLSFVASVWIFLYDYDRWIGMLVFFILILVTTPPPSRPQKETKK